MITYKKLKRTFKKSIKKAKRRFKRRKFDPIFFGFKQSEYIKLREEQRDKKVPIDQLSYIVKRNKLELKRNYDNIYYDSHYIGKLFGISLFLQSDSNE